LVLLGEQLRTVEKVLLNLPFYETEVAKAITGMKSDSASSPNNFTVIFFKKLWMYVKNGIMNMVKDFNMNKLDLKRLNFGIITLVPKVQEANTLKQYRPISLLNVDFKFFPKLLNDRIIPITNNIISESQPAFIKGMNILEGVVILYEVLHELKRSKSKELCLKLTLKKPMTRSNGILSKRLWREKVFHPLGLSKL
jgi:hypothetical protein